MQFEGHAPFKLHFFNIVKKSVFFSLFVLDTQFCADVLRNGVFVDDDVHGLVGHVGL